MTLDQLRGQPRAVNALRKAIRSGALHHAYLFSGPDGVGKETAAAAFVQALFCTQRPGEGCGECSACSRVAHLSHPDAAWVMPEEERVARKLASRSDFAASPSRDIRVEQVRSLTRRLAVHRLEAPLKAAVLVCAERLNPQAQNALLKTLEEPPPGSLLILIASETDKLLPTLKSRCARVEFAPLPRTLVAEQVQRERGLDAETAARVAELSGGSLSRALALDVEALASRRVLFSAFEEALQGEPSGVLRFSTAFGGSRGQAEGALGLLTSWLRDLAVAQVGGQAERLANADLGDLVTEAAARHPPSSLHRWRSLLDETLEALWGNGAPRLQLEGMLLRMRGDA